MFHSLARSLLPAARAAHPAARTVFRARFAPVFAVAQPTARAGFSTDAQGNRLAGTVKWFSDKKGYGTKG